MFNKTSIISDFDKFEKLILCACCHNWRDNINISIIQMQQCEAAILTTLSKFQCEIKCNRVNLFSLYKFT